MDTKQEINFKNSIIVQNSDLLNYVKQFQERGDGKLTYRMKDEDIFRDYGSWEVQLFSQTELLITFTETNNCDETLNILQSRIPNFNVSLLPSRLKIKESNLSLLKWANRYSRGHEFTGIIPPTNFNESWTDGLCLCALL